MNLAVQIYDAEQIKHFILCLHIPAFIFICLLLISVFILSLIHVCVLSHHLFHVHQPLGLFETRSTRECSGGLNDLICLPLSPYPAH